MYLSITFYFINKLIIKLLKLIKIIYLLLLFIFLIKYNHQLLLYNFITTHQLF
jgi:hypothetical protein